MSEKCQKSASRRFYCFFHGDDIGTVNSLSDDSGLIQFHCIFRCLNVIKIENIIIKSQNYNIYLAACISI